VDVFIDHTVTLLSGSVTWVNAPRAPLSSRSSAPCYLSTSKKGSHCHSSNIIKSLLLGMVDLNLAMVWSTSQGLWCMTLNNHFHEITRRLRDPRRRCLAPWTRSPSHVWSCISKAAQIRGLFNLCSSRRTTKNSVYWLSPCLLFY